MSKGLHFRTACVSALCPNVLALSDSSALRSCAVISKALHMVFARRVRVTFKLPSAKHQDQLQDVTAVQKYNSECSFLFAFVGRRSKNSGRSLHASDSAWSSNSFVQTIGISYATRH